MTKQPSRALILDDDPWIGELLRARLETSIPNLDVEFRTEPDCSGTFDIYFVDNNFGGNSLATELVHEIRRDHQAAWIVVFSGKLERPDLIELVRANCDLVCEKHDPSGMDAMIQDVQRLLRTPRPATQPRRTLGNTIRSLADLIYQLNSKLKRGSPSPDHVREMESQ